MIIRKIALVTSEGGEWLFAAFLVASISLCWSVTGKTQTIDTVREDAFRARWADYQVDVPEATTLLGAQSYVAPTGLLGVLTGKSLDQRLPGPFQIRSNIATGWEYSDEADLRPDELHRSYESPFASGALGLFYNRDFGPITLSARYSAGYTYYFDRNYVGSSNNGGIFSQTAGLDLNAESGRNSFLSTSSASYGNGDDIESGELRDRFAVGEAVTEAYQVTNAAIVGGNGHIDYTSYTGGTVAGTTTVSDAGTAYISYVISDKTRLRLELGAGEDQQEPSSRSYVQALLAANWVPTAKLSVDAGFGLGDQHETDTGGLSGNGAHLVYTLTLRYAATEKTSGSFHLGYEGVDIKPDLALQVQWEPRQNTLFKLSVYQTSNFSTYVEAQSLVTRGVLITAQQRLLEKVVVELSGGAEQSAGYSVNTASAQMPRSEKPYYFGNVSLLWPINSWLSFQTYYRGYTGQPGALVSDDGRLQSRASVSFRVTF